MRVASSQVLFLTLAVASLGLQACTAAPTVVETTRPPAGTMGAASTVTSAPPPLASLYDVSDLVKDVRPGVVTVSTIELRFDMFFRYVEEESGTGSGFVIDDAGHIVTNFHVIRGAESVLVFGEDGTQRDARVIGGSQFQDLAVLQVLDTEGLRPLELGSSADMEVGNPVVAIGNALGLDATSPSVSVGILSAKGRSLDVDNARLSNALQTDAAINPGNSGGPLLNEAGQVIGINVAVAQGAENIGFAIAVDEARPIIESILSSVGEPFIGVNLRDNTADIANRFGLATESGAIVLDVLPGGPADRAGIEIGDIIVAIDGEPATTADGVNTTIARLTPGSAVEVQVVRGRQTGSLIVDVEAR